MDKLRGYLNVIVYYCIGSLALEALLMVLVYCYIGSLRDRNQEFDYKMLG